MLEDTEMLLSKFGVFLFIQNDICNALVTSDHFGASNITMLRLDGSLGLDSVPIVNDNSILGAFEVLDKLFADTSEVLQSKLDLGSMQL